MQRITESNTETQTYTIEHWDNEMILGKICRECSSIWKQDRFELFLWDSCCLYFRLNQLARMVWNTYSASSHTICFPLLHHVGVCRTQTSPVQYPRTCCRDFNFCHLGCVVGSSIYLRPINRYFYH